MTSMGMTRWFLLQTDGANGDAPYKGKNVGRAPKEPTQSKALGFLGLAATLQIWVAPNDQLPLLQLFVEEIGNLSGHVGNFCSTLLVLHLLLDNHVRGHRAGFRPFF